jgi:hypothetical protein
LDESPGLLKPLNPAEQFRRHAHFRLEDFNELLGKEIEAERDFARCLELDSSMKSSLDKAVRAAKNRH